jgi:hypothetical protein
MIQRIQTIYYAVAFLLAATPLLGYPLITFMENGDEMQITGYGNNLWQIRTLGSETTNFEDTWLHLCSWILMVLLIVTMLSFKNLKRQFLLGRITLVVYLLSILLIVLIALQERSVCGSCEMTNMWPTIWFWLFAAGIFFVYFGNKGVRKDRKLLDSLNRLR